MNKLRTWFTGTKPDIERKFTQKNITRNTIVQIVLGVSAYGAIEFNQNIANEVAQYLKPGFVQMTGLYLIQDVMSKVMYAGSTVNLIKIVYQGIKELSKGKKD